MVVGGIRGGGGNDQRRRRCGLYSSRSILADPPIDSKFRVSHRRLTLSVGRSVRFGLLL
jgi:hypothetical protein